MVCDVSDMIGVIWRVCVECVMCDVLYVCYAVQRTMFDVYAMLCMRCDVRDMMSVVWLVCLTCVVCYVV